jgi:AhpD family alkylhydroperoxidase
MEGQLRRSVARMSTTTPTARLNLAEKLPRAYAAMARLDAVAREGLDDKLRTLIELRVSQINGCAFCLDLHARVLRTLGESQLRIDVLRAWREVDLYDERERAALAFAEAVTLIHEDGVSDAVWADAAAQFDEDELAALWTTCIAINAWNRLSITGRTQPDGQFVPGA